MTQVTIQQAIALAIQHHQSGRLREAEMICRQILAQHPNHPGALHVLGAIAGHVGRYDLAVDLIRQAIALAPDHADYHCNLGMFLQKQGQFDQAIACYQRALEINPGDAITLNNLGVAQINKGQLDQGIASYQRSLEIKPDFAQAHNNLGNAWAKKGRIDQAIASCHGALEINPDLPEAHNNLGIALVKKGRLDEAIIHYQRALALKPNYSEAYANLGKAWKDKGQLDDALACCRKALQLNPRYVGAHDNLLLVAHYHPDFDAPRLFAESQKWNEQHGEPLQKSIQPHTNDRNPDRRLRVGYVSPDFYHHPVGRFMLPLLAQHDRNAFEVFCYANLLQHDRTTERLKQHAHHWQNIVGQSDEQAAEQIRGDRIDILVDLAMHTANNRLLVFARKPAPVQATYLGCVGTSGLQTMDYRLTDRYLDPDDADERYYTEKSIRLPGTYWCYQPNDTAPPVNDLPALKTGRITLGCLNNYCKVTRDTLETWAALLRRLGQAVLLLRSPEGNHREGLIGFMQERGIDPARLLISQVSPAEYFQAYGRMDIALDPFPYPGGSTTCDALWMGVPVVTLSGRTAAGRAGVSILSNAGLPELIARGPDEYVHIATNLAADLPRLRDLRAMLRRRMENSPLMDAAGFARNMEAAYRAMWRKWCA